MDHGGQKEDRDLSKVKIAVGAYKLVGSPKKFEQEFSSCEKMGTTCVVFHYGSVLENPAMEEYLTRRR